MAEPRKGCQKPTQITLPAGLLKNGKNLCYMTFWQ